MSFGLNIPVYAAPLYVAAFATAFGMASFIQGFAAMAIFGGALSLPLAAAVFSGVGRRWLDRLAALSHRAPRWTGLLFVSLGLWSIYLGATA